MSDIQDIGERKLDVFMRRTGLKNGVIETLQEIANVYGVSRERVRQLEESGYEMITKRFGDVSSLVRFVSTWQSCESPDAVGRELGIKPLSASSKACALRKSGFPLKRFRKGRSFPKPLTERQRASVDPAVARRVERNDTFIKMWNQGYAPKDIAKELGYSSSASVHAKARQLASRGFPVSRRNQPRAEIVPAEVFVRAWNSSDNMDEVCRKTGMTRYAVAMRCNALRKKGITLKWYRLNRPFTAEDIARLKLAALEELEKCLKK